METPGRAVEGTGPSTDAGEEVFRGAVDAVLGPLSHGTETQETRMAGTDTSHEADKAGVRGVVGGADGVDHPRAQYLLERVPAVHLAVVCVRTLAGRRPRAADNLGRDRDLRMVMLIDLGDRTAQAGQNDKVDHVGHAPCHPSGDPLSRNGGDIRAREVGLCNAAEGTPAQVRHAPEAHGLGAQVPGETRLPDALERGRPSPDVRDVAGATQATQMTTEAGEEETVGLETVSLHLDEADIEAIDDETALRRRLCPAVVVGTRKAWATESQKWVLLERWH